MDVESLAKELILKNMTPEQQKAVLDSVHQSVAQAKEIQKRKIGENVDLVIQALKKIESDIRERFDLVGNAIEKRVASIKDGRDGADGKDGRDGKDGKPGRDGAKGDKGDAGRDGRDGIDGVDGVSVTNARIDFDGSLVIVLSNGVELNVGDVVAPDLAESIKVITNGGGTSQSVLDTLSSLQTQINNLIPSQTGNSGKFLTTNGSALSWASVTGSGLNYQGTWNASTNTPTLTSSTGTSGYYYVVATAGSTNLDGITDWKVGDWVIFNGSIWQKIDQSETLQTITSTDGSITVSTVGTNVDLSAVSATNVLCQVRNTTGATLTKGTAVYISGATGQIPTVTKAQANSDTSSAQTLGLISADLANNTNGYVTIIGLISDIDTSAYTDGAQLYLSGTTAGALTATKTYAPTHLVYVAVVEYAHAVHGKLFVKVQNGYEMDELHNVSAQSPSDGQTLIYNTSTSLWEKANITAGGGISITNGAGSITVANSGVTSAVAGTGISVSGATGAVTITNSAPDQTVSLTAGTGMSASGTYPNFTITNTGVTSVTGTSPVVSSGGTTPAISLESGYGDTQNPYASKTANYFLAAPNGSAGAPTFRAIVAADIPTLNQNTTGTASNVTGTVAIANGGTGLTSYTAGDLPYYATGTAFSKLGIGTSNQVLTSSGTAPQWSSALTVTGLTDSGNLTFTGTGNRITGDFSNATLASRVAFQSSTTNGNTSIGAIPNGTSVTSSFVAFAGSDTANSSYGYLQMNNASMQLVSAYTGTGTYLPMTFNTGGSERMRIDTSGRMLLGTLTAYDLSPTGSGQYGVIQSWSNTTTPTSGAIDQYWVRYSNDTAGAAIVLVKTRGTSVGTNTVVQSGDIVGNIVFRGADGTNYINAASIQAVVDNTPGTNDMPGRLVFNTTANGAAVVSERMRIDSSGNVLVTNAAGLGYGSGAGGTVTQATSKSTAVTLNKPTGQITMNAAALAAGASVTFSFSNSLIASTDCLVMNLISTQGTPASYRLKANIGTGGANITLTNESAGSLSEGLTINFAIIKGATS